MNKGLLAGGLVLLLTLGLLGGCSAAGENEGSGDIPPGTLVRLEYTRVRGTVAGEDFSLSLSPEEILWASYWAEEDGGYRPEETEHVPITPDQWAEVEQAVLDLYPALAPLVWQEPDRLDQLQEEWTDVQMLDGGDRDEFTLTWQTGEGEEILSYAQPNDPGVLTLITLLEELALTGEQLPELSD